MKTRFFHFLWFLDQMVYYLSKGFKAHLESFGANSDRNTLKKLPK